MKDKTIKNFAVLPRVDTESHKSTTGALYAILIKSFYIAATEPRLITQDHQWFVGYYQHGEPYHTSIVTRGSLFSDFKIVIILK